MSNRRPPMIVRDDAVRRRVMDVIANLDLSKPWKVTVEPHRKKRSLSQNALMWAWVNKIADEVGRETGNDADDIHEFFKAKFLPARVVEIDGVTVERRTTTTLTTAEMTEYMDRIHAWATGYLGMLLPLPIELENRNGR